MKKHIFILLTAVLTFSGCYNKASTDKPTILLSEDKMVNVLIDFSIINSAKSINKKALEDKNIQPLEWLLKKHNIDSLTFKENNKYYTYNLELYESVYGRVRDSLELYKEDAIKRTEIKNTNSSELIKQQLDK